MSFLRRLFRSSPPAPVPASAPGRRNALAMVLLRGAGGLDLAGLREAVAARVSPIAKIGAWETKGGAATAGIPGDSPPVVAAAAEIPGGSLGLVVMPVPVPADDLHGPVLLAWHWPQAAEAAARHTAHVVVFAGSTELDAIDTHLVVTRAVGAILEHADALGVYVGDAMLVRSAADYAQDAASASRDNPPLLSWIGFQLVGGSDGLSAYTTGLSGFGFLELEARNSRLSREELLGTLASIASYQVSTGNAIGDGETFGETEEDRTRVRHASSRFMPHTRVALVDLP